MPHLIAFSPLAVAMSLVGLGALIFFHELGHFIACRLTGTRVEAFSIGFGPMLWGWRRGHTLYRIGAIPLGGYVKMAAENPGERGTGAPDELPNKSFSQRLFIFTAGVLFNAILALVLFATAFRIGVPFPKPEIGGVDPGSPAWVAGLRRGDVIESVNGSPALSFTDLAMASIVSSRGEILHLKVLRDGKQVEVAVEPRYDASLGAPAIGVTPMTKRAAKEVEPGSPVAKAGGEAGDEVLALDGTPVRDWSDLMHRLFLVTPPSAKAKTVSVRLRVRRKDGRTKELAVSFPVNDKPQIGVFASAGRTIRKLAEGRKPSAFLEVGDRLLAVNEKPLADLTLLRDRPLDAPVNSLTIERKGKQQVISVVPPFPLRDLADSVLGKTDPDTTLVVPRPGMPAAGAGLEAGDLVRTVDGTAVKTWQDMHAAVSKNGLKPIRLGVERDGKAIQFTLDPLGTVDGTSLGYGIENETAEYRAPGVFSAIATGWRRTIRMIEMTALQIPSLLTGRVSTKGVSGPITIGRIAYQTWLGGIGYYLYILAFISVILAIMNILPIPILDGGQVLFLVIEKVRGRPLSERTVGIFQTVGLVLLLGLMVLAFTNDITSLLG